MLHMIRFTLLCNIWKDSFFRLSITSATSIAKILEILYNRIDIFWLWYNILQIAVGTNAYLKARIGSGCSQWRSRQEGNQDEGTPLDLADGPPVCKVGQEPDGCRRDGESRDYQIRKSDVDYKDVSCQISASSILSSFLLYSLLYLLLLLFMLWRKEVWERTGLIRKLGVPNESHFKLNQEFERPSI